MFYRLLFISCFFFLQTAVAQSRYNFFSIGIGQGLSNANIWSINQDKYGFMWIATVNGLNRYDGHSIRQYFHKTDEKNSIAGNTCYWVFKDSDGDMWFACGRDGLSKYNYANDNFESLAPYDSARKNNRYTSPVWRFGEDKQKRIYLSCGAALYRYEKRTGKFEDLTALFGKDWDSGIGNFYMENNETMWMPTDDGLFKYNVSTNEIRKIKFDAAEEGFGSARMYDIVPVNEKELLIPTPRAGYVIIDKTTEKFRAAADFFNPAKTGRYTEMGDVLKDSEGRIWMTNTTYGLMEYFPKDGRAVLMKEELLYPYPYPDQEGPGKTIFEDRDGNIWYGTSAKGIVRFKPAYNFISIYQRDYSADHSLPSNYVTSFAGLDKGSTAWIGTDKGICEYGLQTKKYTNYPSAINFNARTSVSFTRSINMFNDTLVISTNDELIFYNLHNRSFKRYTNTGDSNNIYEPFSNAINTVINYQPGEYILVKNKIGRFYPSSGKCYYNKNTSGDPLYQLEEVNTAAIDKATNKLWIEAYKNELYEYDLVSKKITKHIYYNEKDSLPEIITIAVDSRNNVWMGTQKGIVQYDPVLHKGILIAVPGSNKMVLNICCTDTGWIWFTTQDAVGRVNITSRKIETFDIGTLLPNAIFYRRSITADAHGNLWVGSDQGFLVLDTKRFRANAGTNTPKLVSFKVFDESKNIAAAYPDMQRIDLDYEENFFTFEFSSFNFQNAANTKYSYMLEGFDKGWNYTSKPAASYTNVPPGTYALKIRSSNINGNWDEMSRTVEIHIEAPFWQQTWFVLMILSLGLLLLWWIYRVSEKSRKKKNIDKTIGYFANSVYGQNSINEICWDIARNCTAQLQFEDCVIYLFDDKSNRYVQKAAYGPKNPKGHETIEPIEIEAGEGIVGTVALTGKALLIGDTGKDKRYIVDDHRRFSEITVPILHDGKVIGIIDSEHSRKNFFTDDHLRALTTIASISANKIAEAKAEALAKENEIKVLEINKMLAESQLMAMRAQMNPHFVFNCLNSIQECIVTQKYGEASRYLNKFSKLFRMVLNNSDRKLISLSDEKEVLELYLELEQMRFEKSFSYAIVMDDNLDADEILIPSMLIQPFVENALWHGLMHKDGERKLHIEFKAINEDVFQCMVEDNGIGRKKSFELKADQSKTKRHESKGLKISKDRLDVLQRQGFHASLDMIDKYDEQQNSLGTKIMIELSTELIN